MSDGDGYFLTLGNHEYEARKITLPRQRGALIRFDFSDEARAITLPARGAEGVDVSRWQGLFDWHSVLAMGVTWAYIRCTMGAPNKTQSGIDDRWRHNRQRARSAGITDGVYHFFPPDALPEDQADNLEREIQGDFGGLPITVDVERRRDINDIPEAINKVDFTTRLYAFLEILEGRYGHKPLIYTSKMEWEEMTILPAWEKDYGFFVAQYAPVLTAIRPQWRVVAWQYSTTDGKLDRDRWLGGDAPAPGPRHNFAPRTNQNVINLFHSAAGQAKYIAWIERAGLNSILTSNTRTAVYSGPDIEDLHGLTDAEKAALIAKL